MSEKISKAEEFYYKEDCVNNEKYNSPRIEWYFSHKDMWLFAENYHQSEFKKRVKDISDDIPTVIVEKGTLCGCGAELTNESVGMGIVNGKPSFLKTMTPKEYDKNSIQQKIKEFNKTVEYKIDLYEGARDSECDWLPYDLLANFVNYILKQ